MIRARNSCILISALMLLAAIRAYAHPHVFITNHLSVKIEGSVLTVIEVEWTFDKLYSSMILTDFDVGKKGSFDEAETKILKRGAFDNLKNYHYFLALEVNGKTVALPVVENFRPSVSGSSLIYRFSVPIKLRLMSGAQTTVGITIYDDTYYVAFDKISPADVSIESSPQADCAVSIEKTKVKAVWPGQYMPDQVVLRIKEP